MVSQTLKIIDAITEAIKRVKTQRAFKLERGYQGELKSKLDEVLRDRNIFPDETLIEQEY